MTDPTTTQLLTLPDLLRNLADRHGDRPAMIFDERELGFRELEARSTRLAAAMHALGVCAGDAVAVWLPNCFFWVELHFALAKLGAILVNVNTRYRSHEVQGIIERSGATWLVLQPRFRRIDFLSILDEVDLAVLDGLSTIVTHDGAVDVERVAGKRTLTSEDLLARGGDTLPAESLAAAPERPFVTFTSSGSTGLPKLILHTQRSIAEHVQNVARTFFADDDAVVLEMLPFCGVFGYDTFLGALAGGHPSVVLDAFDGGQAVDLIERHGVTHTTGTDDMLERVLDAAGEPERIATWREGAFANLSVDIDAAALIARGDAMGPSLYQCYGSSEVQALMSRHPRGAPLEERRLGGGIPVSPATEVRVRTLEGDGLERAGQSGELEIRGPNVMAGYLNQPDAAAEAFTADGWFRTGDIGYLVPGQGSRFVYLTRRKDALRLAGFLVSPSEIEEFIEGVEGVASAQAVGVPAPNGERVVAFVIMEPGRELDEQAVIDHCAASLANFKVPQRVFAVEGFPTTPSANGERVQRSKLRERAVQLVAETA